MLTPFGQCLSYYKEMYKSNVNIDQLEPDKFVSKQSVLKGQFGGTIGNRRKSILKYIEYEILVHSSESFPLLTAEEIYLTDDNYYTENGFVLKLSRYEFERLPKPYETNCHNYGNSNRFQCLNECYFNAYMNQIKCIPNYNSLLTIDLSNYSHYSHYIFCQNDDKQRIDEFNGHINTQCKENCPDSCKEVMFLANYQGWKMFERDQKLFLNFEQGYYHIIKFWANMTFLQLVLNIVNVFNAWHGLSFIKVLELLFEFYRRFPRFMIFERISSIIIIKHWLSLFKSKFKVSDEC